MTKTEAKRLYNELTKAQDVLASAWNEVIQTIVDEHGELQEKFDNLSDKAQEGERGQKLQEKIDALAEFADEYSSEEHADSDGVNTVLQFLDSIANPA